WSPSAPPQGRPPSSPPAAPPSAPRASSSRRSSTVLPVLLNASGCLDALAAPDVARSLDAFVTKTVTPLPRGGNSPVRIAETDVPLYAKLSPATWDMAETARAVEDAGADGLSLVNTIRGLTLDEHTLRPRLGTAVGGLSGPALRPVALAAVWACYRAVSLPIVGMGGVATGRDALELIAAGATHVALGTVLFADPDAPARVRR